MRKSRLSLQTSSETFEMGKRRAVVLEFDPAQPELISIRAAGLRTRYTVTAAALFCMVAEKAASAERAAKRKKGGRR